MSGELLERLSEEWTCFEEDDDLWVAIFTGGGDVAFCSGHDMKDDLADGVHKFTPLRRIVFPNTIWKPTIAAINGYCLAGGWHLAQVCDVRLAAEHATFGIPEVKWNLPAAFGARTEYQISMGVACEMLLWGRTITAQRAYEIGFVNKVVPKERLMAEAMEWAHHVCTLGQPSVRAHKQLLYMGRDMSERDLHAYAADLFYWFPPKPGVVIDATEGPRAFVEGRKSVGDKE